MFENNKNLIVIYTLLTFILTIRIGSGEIQPWDEGLYANRARVVINEGLIFDQTEYSIGGLYSSTYPPLTVWMMSLSFLVWGQNAVGVRFFSVICSAFSLIIFYHLLKKYFKKENIVIYGLIFLSTNLLWNQFSRQGMTDIPMLTFIMLSFLAILNIHSAKTRKEKYTYALVLTLSFALGLMTKIVVSLIPLLFVLISIIMIKRNRIVQILSIFFGFLLSFPWYYYMINSYGWEFANALFPSHLNSFVENNISWLGIFYYINQLLVSNPLFLLSFIFIILIIVFSKNTYKNLILSFSSSNGENNDEETENNKNIKKILFFGILFWFIAGLVVFSLAQTKLAHYTLYFIPPGIFLIMVLIDNISQFIKSAKALYFIYLALFICTFWSSSESFRNSFKSLTTPNGIGILFIVVFVILLLIGIILNQDKLKSLVEQVDKRIWFVLSVFLIARICFLNMFVPVGYSFGANETAFFLNETNVKNFVYLHHSRSDADKYNPQLGWYTKGWLYGWIAEKTYIPISLSENKYELKIINKINDYPNEIIIYYLPEDKKIAKLVIDEILETRPFIEQYKRYVIFGKKRNKKLFFDKLI